MLKQSLGVAASDLPSGVREGGRLASRRIARLGAASHEDVQTGDDRGGQEPRGAASLSRPTMQATDRDALTGEEQLTGISFGVSQSLESPWQVHPRPSPVNTLQRYLCRSDPICPSWSRILNHAGQIPLQLHHRQDNQCQSRPPQTQDAPRRRPAQSDRTRPLSRIPVRGHRALTSCLDSDW